MSTRPSRASRPKKKQQPKKPRTRQRTQNRALVRQPRVNLSHCALAYAKALADPFDYGANELPCIPDMIDQPSFRFVVRTRGIITTNAAGFASLLVNPLAAASDRSFIIATDSAYVGTTVPGIGGTGANTITNTQFPYTAAGARPHRTVSAALRVRYIGTTLNQSGSVILACERGPTGSLGDQTYNTLGTRLDADAEPCTRAWRSISWCPAYDDMYNYTNQYPAMSTSAGLLVACVGNAGAANMSWEYEVVIYKEIQPQGSFTVAAMEKSHSDPVGFGIVRDFFSDITFKEVGGALYNKFLTFVKSGVATAASSYIGLPPQSLMLTL